MSVQSSELPVYIVHGECTECCIYKMLLAGTLVSGLEALHSASVQPQGWDEEEASMSKY